MGGRPGPIQNREDFEKYPFSEIAEIFWNKWEPHLNALSSVMPSGMKALGGCGYGVFEISEDLVGFEYLCLLQHDDPELFSELYRRIGDLMVALWSRLLDRFGDHFAVCRMGDDLGFKSSTLLAPNTIIEHILPQYRRIIGLVHSAGKPFLLHSCGKIFAVMEEIVAAGIDAKHSNEDQIAPFAQWIERYNDRIGLFGGIDVDLLCRNDPRTVYEEVLLRGTEYRRQAKGFALGSGNSIPHYVPVDSYLAMIEAAREIRRREEN
jgi:uroporphyrinogen decarboxylase